MTAAKTSACVFVLGAVAALGRVGVTESVDFGGQNGNLRVFSGQLLCHINYHVTEWKEDEICLHCNGSQSKHNFP